MLVFTVDCVADYVFMVHLLSGSSLVLEAGLTSRVGVAICADLVCKPIGTTARQATRTVAEISEIIRRLPQLMLDEFGSPAILR